MWVQGEAESLVGSLSFAATWDEVSLGCAQTLEVGNASRSTSLNIASLWQAKPVKTDRFPVESLEKKKPTKACLLCTVNRYTALMLLFSFHNDRGSVLIIIFLLKPLFFIPMSVTAMGFARHRLCNIFPYSGDGTSHLRSGHLRLNSCILSDFISKSNLHLKLSFSHSIQRFAYTLDSFNLNQIYDIFGPYLKPFSAKTVFQFYFTSIC